MEIKSQWRDGTVEARPETVVKMWPQFLDPTPAALLDVRLRKALLYAISLARQFGAKLTLLHVIEPIATPDFEASFPIALENQQARKFCDDVLKQTVEKFEIAPLLEQSLAAESDENTIVGGKERRFDRAVRLQRIASQLFECGGIVERDDRRAVLRADHRQRRSIRAGRDRHRLVKVEGAKLASASRVIDVDPTAQ